MFKISADKQVVMRVACWVVLVVAAALRVFHLGKNDLWYDEAFTVKISAKFSTLHLPVHGYYSLIHLWRGVFGAGEFWLRFPSVCFSVVGLFILFKFTARSYSRRVTFYAVTMMGLSAFQVWYAQEARPYALLMMLGAASIYVFQDVLEKGTLTSWCLFVAISLWGIHAHGYYLGLFLAQCVVLAAHRWPVAGVSLRRQIAVGVVLAVMAAGFLSIPRIAFFIQFMDRLRNGFWIQMPGPWAWLITAENFLCGYGLDMMRYAVAGCLIVLLFAYALKGVMVSRKVGVWAMVLLILPFVFLYLASWSIAPVYQDRGLVVITPLFSLLMAIGMAEIRPKIVQYAIFMAIAVLQVMGLRAYFLNEMPTTEQQHHAGVHLKKDFHHPVRFLNENMQRQDRLFVTNNMAWPSLRYYGLQYPAGSIKLLYVDGAIDEMTSRPVEPMEWHQSAEDLLLSGIERVWVVDGDWDRGSSRKDGHDAQRLHQLLDRRYSLVERKDFDGLFVMLYVLRSSN